MIKVFPYQFNTNVNTSRREKDKKSFNPSFCADSFKLENFPISWVQIKQKTVPFAPSWLTDPTILEAVNRLNDLEFAKEDVDYIHSLGIMLPFSSGKDAINFIKKSNVRIKFDNLAMPGIHAQYDFDTNFIKINKIYENTKNSSEIFAIAEAILHEAGHAFDDDGTSSVQEEIECLALNAVSHRAFLRKHPNAFTDSSSLIVKDGVCVYAKLFFDNSPNKEPLVERIKSKYGFLPAGDFKHPPSEIAFRIKGA